MEVIIMRFLLIIVATLGLFNCSSNMAKLEDKNTINGGPDLISTYAMICNEHKSTEKEFYSCGSGYSSDLDLARNKAILQAKTNIADKISSTVLKNEKEVIVETTKEGVNKKFDSNSSSQVFETTLSKYQIVYDKSFYESGKYRSFVIIKYTVDS
jgi:hypothetical protein